MEQRERKGKILRTYTPESLNSVLNDEFKKVSTPGDIVEAVT